MTPCWSAVVLCPQTAAHKYEASVHVTRSNLFTTDRSRQLRVSQGLLIPRLTPGIRPEDGYSSKFQLRINDVSYSVVPLCLDYHVVTSALCQSLGLRPCWPSSHQHVSPVTCPAHKSLNIVRIIRRWKREKMQTSQHRVVVVLN